VVLGKLAHYGLLLALPLTMHSWTDVVAGYLAYNFVQSIVLSATFAVSHNVDESKPLSAGPTQVGAGRRLLPSQHNARPASPVVAAWLP
jgi:fatty acid desaturase (delta-4 desaturase)